MSRLETPDELPLSRKPDPAQIPIELVRRQQSVAAAFSLACQASGLDDKEIYLQIAIDAGTFSRIKKGDATLQAEKLADFCRTVGNTVYPQWLAYQIGCTLTMLETESERQLKSEREANDKLAAENKLLRELLQGRAK